MLVIEGRLPPEQGALVVQALRAVEDRLNEERFRKEQGDQEQAAWGPADVSADGSAGAAYHVSAEVAVQDAEPVSAEGAVQDTSRVSAERSCFPEEPREEPAAHKADALSLMAELALALANGSAISKNAERYHVMLHVPVSALRLSAETHDRQEPLTHARIQDGPDLSAETARRLSCDASVTSLTESAEGHPLNVGRKTRTIPPALRRALRARDDGCQFPGCNAHRFVDAHHIQHWADGGETKLDNLVTLCRFHHRLLHEEGYRIDLRHDGHFDLRRPEGSLISQAPAFPALPTNPLHTLAATHSDQSLDIDAQTIPVWAGDRLDMDVAMEWLGGSGARLSRNFALD